MPGRKRLGVASAAAQETRPPCSFAGSGRSAPVSAPSGSPSWRAVTYRPAPSF